MVSEKSTLPAREKRVQASKEVNHNHHFRAWLRDLKAHAWAAVLIGIVADLKHLNAVDRDSDYVPHNCRFDYIPFLTP